MVATLRDSQKEVELGKGTSVVACKGSGFCRMEGKDPEAEPVGQAVCIPSQGECPGCEMFPEGTESSRTACKVLVI